MPNPAILRTFRTALRCLPLAALALLALAPAPALAGGPKYVAGTSFFNPAVLGQPIHWAGGQLNYYVDQGPLSASVSNQQATAMVDAAAALWSAIPTAGVTLTDKGPLNEDVSGSNILVNSSGQIAQPSDVTPSGHQLSPRASSTTPTAPSSMPSSAPPPASPPVARTTASSSGWTTSTPTPPSPTPSSCSTASAPPTPASSQMMSYELERAFGRVLGLDYSQVNPGALQNGEPGGTAGWPVMQPLSGVCGPSGGAVHPQPRRPPLRRHRRPQPHLPHHRAKPLQLPRQAAHRRQHHLHPGHHHLPHRPRHARRQRRRPPPRRQRQSPLPIHRHLRLRRILLRQSRQPRHRL